MTNDENPIKSLLTPGARLKHVRSLVRLSRAQLEKKYNIAQSTLKTWENETAKMSIYNIQRCIDIFRKEGWIVSEDWILDGEGLEPTPANLISNYFTDDTRKKLPLAEDEIAMINDVKMFKDANPNSVVMLVSNDDMRPIYKPGDYVGGKLRTKNLAETSIGKDCIVYLKSGGQFFRRVNRNKDGGYNLACTNPNETTDEPVMYNVEIEMFAPIIWHRWKDV